jgi:hypothetical protein
VGVKLDAIHHVASAKDKEVYVMAVNVSSARNGNLMYQTHQLSCPRCMNQKRKVKLSQMI